MSKIVHDKTSDGSDDFTISQNGYDTEMTSHSLLINRDIDQQQKLLIKNEALKMDEVIEDKVRNFVDALLDKYNGDQKKMLHDEPEFIQRTISSYYAISYLKQAANNLGSNILNENVLIEAVRLVKPQKYLIEFCSLSSIVNKYPGVMLDYIWQNVYNTTKKDVPDDFLKIIECIIHKWKEEKVFTKYTMDQWTKSEVTSDDILSVILQGAELGLSVNTVYMCFAAIMLCQDEYDTMKNLIPYYGEFGCRIPIYKIVSYFQTIGEVLPNNPKDILCVMDKIFKRESSVVEYVDLETYKLFEHFQETKSKNDTYKSDKVAGYKEKCHNFSKKCAEILQDVMYIPLRLDLSDDDINKCKTAFVNEIRSFTSSMVHSDDKNAFLEYVKDQAVNCDVSEFIVLYAHMINEGIIQDCDKACLSHGLGLLGTSYEILDI